MQNLNCCQVSRDMRRETRQVQGFYFILVLYYDLLANTRDLEWATTTFTADIDWYGNRKKLESQFQAVVAFP